ncbi:hypothetical protein Sjap_023688 [Stephania japonica]|uniref:BHLH domain-containing protein n=1 Tax=Stephania japonica TaxID=461633 RepID=A0AAP0HN75_9MAGN
MELPRPRPFGTEERTLDFLSLHGHSSFQHPDQRAQRSYLETQDFLKPLEQVEKNSSTTNKATNAIGENKINTIANNNNNNVGKMSPLSSSSPSSSSVEHILPGGIGTYSISHISNFINKVPKTEQIIPGGAAITTVADRANSVERNYESNDRSADSGRVSSYARGGVFTLWDESAVKNKGEACTVPKDVLVERQVLREVVDKTTQWSSERASQAPFAHHRSTSFSSLSSSKQSSPNKNRSFVEMMKSGRGLNDDEDEAVDEEFTSRKAASSHQGEKNADQKASTPRSKHSATEQRRRSKINDRFQILRDLIPQNDQKRDKASFLLEVIEYIQFLQGKVHRYESSYQGWNQEPLKLTPWKNGDGPGESTSDHSRAVKSNPGPTMTLMGKFDDSNIAFSPNMLATSRSSLEPDLNCGSVYTPLNHCSGLVNKAMPIQSSSITPAGRSEGLAYPLQRPDTESTATQLQPQLWPSKDSINEFPVSGDVLNEQEELTVEGGTINISGVYSQGLLNNLSQALQSLGVDLSLASISVQVDLGKRANRQFAHATSGVKDCEAPSNVRTMNKVENRGGELDRAYQKRRKTE